MFLTIWMHLGPFGCLTKLSAKRAEVVEKFVPRSRVIIFLNEHTELTPWDLNSCFGVFRTIWMHLGPFGCLTKLSAKRAAVVENSCHEVASEFFATNAPDPPHWTLN